MLKWRFDTIPRYIQDIDDDQGLSWLTVTNNTIKEKITAAAAVHASSRLRRLFSKVQSIQ